MTDDSLKALRTLHKSIVSLRVRFTNQSSTYNAQCKRIFTSARDLLVVLLVLAVIAFVAVLGPLQLQLAPLCVCVPSAMFRLRRCDFFLLRRRFSSSWSAKTAASASLLLIFSIQHCKEQRSSGFTKTASCCSFVPGVVPPATRLLRDAACLLAAPCRLLMHSKQAKAIQHGTRPRY
jgi:hypothetical protein